MQLVEIIRNMEPRLRSRLSHLYIDYDVGEATVTCSYALYGPVGTGRAQYATVDDKDLPPDVSLGGVERWPDSLHSIDLSPSVHEQIAALDESGLVGNLDSRFFDRAPASPRYRWHVVTHAGSDRERQQWLLER